MTKLTSLGDAPAKQQDQPLSGAGESFIGKISGPIEKPVRRQKTRRTENAQVKEEAAQQTERNKRDEAEAHAYRAKHGRTQKDDENGKIGPKR